MEGKIQEMVKVITVLPPSSRNNTTLYNGDATGYTGANGLTGMSMLNPGYPIDVSNYRKALIEVTSGATGTASSVTTAIAGPQGSFPGSGTTGVNGVTITRVVNVTQLAEIDCRLLPGKNLWVVSTIASGGFDTSSVNVILMDPIKAPTGQTVTVENN